MDIHINKKIAGLMVLALIVGGVIGAAVGFVAGHEGDHHEQGRYEMGRGQFDREANDDKEELPNSNEQAPSAQPVQTQNGAMPAPVQ